MPSTHPPCIGCLLLEPHPAVPNHARSPLPSRWNFVEFGTLTHSQAIHSFSYPVFIRPRSSSFVYLLPHRSRLHNHVLPNITLINYCQYKEHTVNIFSYYFTRSNLSIVLPVFLPSCRHLTKIQNTTYIDLWHGTK